MHDEAKARELLSAIVAISRQWVDEAAVVDAARQCDGQTSLLDEMAKCGAITESQHQELQSLVNSDSEDYWNTLDEQGQPASVIERLREALLRSGEDDWRSSLDEVSTIIDDHAAEPVVRPVPPVSAEGERFRIRKELARGGLGQVFVAQDRQLNRNVALKQILERWQDHSSSNERFLLEAEITGRLEHPGVVPVYALGHQPDGRYYYAMRLIRGETLEEQLRDFYDSDKQRAASENNLIFRRLLRQFVDVCNTIEYAHSRGVIHRDLKPSNIMIGKYGETLVVDWGLAKQIDVAEAPVAPAAESMLVPESGSGGSTRMGSALGTPQYMSPEQAKGRLDEVGVASDIYCLGTTFYHLLTGKPPQTARSLAEIMDCVKKNQFPSPESVRPDVPKPLTAVCMKAMGDTAEDRYRSPTEMAEDIERWLADQRVLAYDEPLHLRFARTLRRHQTIAAATAVAVLLTSVMVVVGTLLTTSYRIRQKEDALAVERAERKRDQEIERQFAQRSATTDNSLRSGLREAKVGRFRSAIDFFKQGEAASEGEPKLADQYAKIRMASRQIEKLVSYWELSDEAMFASAIQEDTRAMLLLADALQELGVLPYPDWWNHLPTEYLDAREADRVERQVHSDLVMLASLLAKTVLAQRQETKVEKDHAMAMRLLVRRIARIAQLYSHSEWIEWVFDVEARLDDPNADPSVKYASRKVERFNDALFFGMMSVILSHQESDALSQAAKLFTDMPVDSEPTVYLRLATQLRPDNYIAHVSLGWGEHLAGNHDAARAALSHAIALRSDMVLAYDMRSLTSHAEASKMPIDPASTDERNRLLELALRDANEALRIAPDLELIHWLRGNALREMGEHSQAVAAYLDAIDREPPAQMVSNQLFALIFGMQQKQLVRRLGLILVDRFQVTIDYASEYRDRHTSFTLLHAAATGAMGQWDEAFASADQVLQDARIKSVSMKDVARAHAIKGDFYRARAFGQKPSDERDTNLQQASLAYTEALKIDPANSQAIVGIAAILEGRAKESSSDKANAKPDDTARAIQSALGAYQDLSENAFTNWQSVRAEQGKYRLHLMKKDFESAMAALEACLSYDRGQSAQAMRQWAVSAGAESIVDRIDQQDVVQRMIRLDTESVPASLSLRNASFELGINDYWKSWKCAANCVAKCSIAEVTKSPSFGSQSLLIEHQSPRIPGSVAFLQQDVPAIKGRYRISLWSKAETSHDHTVDIEVGANVVTSLPPGRHEWQETAGEFEVTVDSAYPQEIPVRITSTAPGNYWIDEIHIERIIDDESQANVGSGR